MDAALYEKLLEDLRSDLAQTAPMLEELQSVEAFLQRRMGTVKDKSSYQAVLTDISSEINNHNRSIEELKRVDRFVSSQLGKPAFDPQTAPRPSKPKTQVPVEPKTEADVPPAKKSAPKPPAKEPATAKSKQIPANVSSGMTIEFGPDGFPISGGSASEARTGSGMDGPTINFGPDGFPVDFPKSDSKK